MSRMHVHVIALAASLCTAPSATAAAETTRAQSAPQATVLKAARLLDVHTGKYVTPAVVLIDGGNIKAFGSQMDIPADSTEIDLGSLTLLPGLIDAHTHLMASTDDGYDVMLLRKSQATRALEGAANARRTLEAGFTTVRDVENEGSGYADVALRDAIAKGLVPGPRMLVATRGVAALGQYHPFDISADLHDFPTGVQMVSGAEEARRAVREQIGHGADLIKVYADWSHPTLTVEELQVVVEEAHKAGRKVAAHATTVPGINNALEAGVDSIEHGTGIDRPTLERMKKQGVWLVPTTGPFYNGLSDASHPDLQAYMKAQWPVVQQMVRSAREVGVRIASGYDPAELKVHGTNARELIGMHAAGLSELDALRAATVEAAALLGLEKDCGSIEAGKRADLVAVDGDPLKDLHALEAVRFVMQKGKVVRDDRK